MLSGACQIPKRRSHRIDYALLSKSCSSTDSSNVIAYREFVEGHYSL